MPSIEQRCFAALALTLRDRLPAELAARDAHRRATLRCVAGPYAVPADGTLAINGETHALTPGTRTAAELVAELGGAVGFTARDEDGRLVLEGPVPTSSAPSHLAIGQGTAHAALGLDQLDDVQRLACSGWPLRILERPPGQLGILQGPLLIPYADRSAVPQPGTRDRLWRFTFGLQIWVPGGVLPASIEAAAEVALEIERAVGSILREGDERGPGRCGGATVGAGIYLARVSRYSAMANWMGIPLGEGQSTIVSVGFATPELEFQIDISHF